MGSFTIFHQKTGLTQDLHQLLEGVLVFTPQGVQVNAPGEVGQGAHLVGLCLLDKLGHIVAGGEVQLAHQLAVHRVLHHHRLHGAPVIHHQVQLPLHILVGVAAGHGILPPLGGGVHHIAPGGGENVGAGGPQQGHVSHDDLAAHLEGVGQPGGGERLLGLGEIL